MKNLKQKIQEMPDNLIVTKVLIETINKFGEKHKIEFDKNKK